MSKAFVYGKSVEGCNFTDRVEETKRLKLNFENGINSIIISPRRLGKTSLVRKVQKSITDSNVKVVFMDIYDCRSEYDFLNRFASALMKGTAETKDRILTNLQEFLVRVSPKISFSPDALSDFSLSLGITPQSYSPEEILNLPEKIAQKQGIRIVVCIDEFQQIGEFPDSLSVQKRMRSVWQHQQHVSYCMFGSKKHMMMNIFQNKRMPFYQFGDTMYLQKIPKKDWTEFIISRFKNEGKTISEYYAEKICNTVDCYSSYVQQLSWNVLLETENSVTEENFKEGVSTILIQSSCLFENMIENLTTYQMNFLRAVCSGIHSDFASKAVSSEFNIGTKSNVSRIITTLINKELIDKNRDGVFISDPVFELWFKTEFM